MGLLTRGQAALIRRQLQAAAPAGTVTYYRVGDQTTPIDLTGKCWVGRTVFSRLPQTQNNNAPIVFGDQDFLVPVANLPGGEPNKGDRIVHVNGSETTTYKVLPPQNVLEPAWRYSDSSNTVYRIHATRVATPTS